MADKISHVPDGLVISAASKEGIPIFGLLLDVMNTMAGVSHRPINVNNIASFHVSPPVM
jgi:hypothetical protein